MEKYYYKCIQRLNGKHEKRKPVGNLNTKMEIILKKKRAKQKLQNEKLQYLN